MILPPTLRHHRNQWTTKLALGQAMDAAENIELEIGEYNDRIRWTRPTPPLAGAAKKIDARFGGRHRRSLPFRTGGGAAERRIRNPVLSRDEGSNFYGPIRAFFRDAGSLWYPPWTKLKLRRVSPDKREILPPFGGLFFFLTGESHAKALCTTLLAAVLPQTC